MATYQSGLQQDFWSKYYQRRAQKGSTLSASEMASLYEPMLAYDYQKSLAAAERDRQQQNLDRAYQLEKQKADDAAAAAKVSGAVSLVGTGANIYLGKKLLDIYGAKHPVANTTVPVTNADIATASGKFSAPSASEAGYGLTVPPSAPPTLMSKGLTEAYELTPPVAPPEYAVGEGYNLVPGAANLGDTIPPLAAPSAGGAQALLPSAYASAPEAAAITGQGAWVEPAVTPGMPGLGPAMTSAAAIYAGQNVMERVGGFKDVQKASVFGEQAPEAYKWGGATVDIILGPARLADKGLNKLADAVGTVVCSELLRQGRITDTDRRACVRFRLRHIPDEMFAAYTEWATPHVAEMRKGGWRNYIRLPFAHAFVGYMLAVAHGRKPTLLQRAMWEYLMWEYRRIRARRVADPICAEVA